MDNSTKYRFSDFTFANFKKLLILAMKEYEFIEFSDQVKEKSGKYIFLRHDIEFSLPNAVRMAEIEYQLGIKATYFLQVHSEYYNPIDKENYKYVKKIISLGHDIGLHFDSHFWEIDLEDNLEKYILIDKNLIEKYFNIEIQAFSFHTTNEFILSCKKERYANLINVYSDFFKEKVAYNTDSTGYWRYEILEERLKEAKDRLLQVLLHDGMWQDEVLPPRRRIYKVIDDRSIYMKKFYDDKLNEFRAMNVDWDEVL
jgi:hypothetical protein